MRLYPTAAAVLALSLLWGCTSVEGHTETAQIVAERLQGDLSDELEGAAEERHVSDDLDIRGAIARIEPPEGVRLLPGASGQAKAEGGRAMMSAAVVVAPDDGDPYCIVVAVSSDGESAGIAADGDPQQSCRGAQVGGVAPDLILESWDGRLGS